MISQSDSSICSSILGDSTSYQYYSFGEHDMAGKQPILPDFYIINCPVLHDGLFQENQHELPEKDSRSILSELLHGVSPVCDERRK